MGKASRRKRDKHQKQQQQQQQRTLPRLAGISRAELEASWPDAIAAAIAGLVIDSDHSGIDQLNDLAEQYDDEAEGYVTQTIFARLMQILISAKASGSPELLADTANLAGGIAEQVYGFEVANAVSDMRGLLGASDPGTETLTFGDVLDRHGGTVPPALWSLAAGAVFCGALEWEKNEVGELPTPGDQGAVRDIMRRRAGRLIQIWQQS